MRTTIPLLALWILLIGATCARDVRPAAVAGAFYPSDPEVLRKTVDGYISAAPKDKAPGRLVAIVAPHAGYEYSGGVAGRAFRQIQGGQYDTVIILGPTHYYPFRGASVYTGGSFITPLGEVRVDQEMARSLLDEKKDIKCDINAHVKEHSIEVELPFLQRTLKDFSIVPIVVGDYSRDAFDELGSKIASLLTSGKKKILIVVSTDWSHYHGYDTAVRMDTLAISSVEDLSSFELINRARMGDIELCGIFPMMVALDAANKAGMDTARLFEYKNSGDVTGKRDSVVGYAAMGFYAGNGRDSSPGLSHKDESELVKIARATLEAFVNTGKGLSGKPDSPALARPGACFVTLKEKGELRGCIGNFIGEGPLYQAVRDMAVNACSRDNRFMPVAKEELKDIKLEISVLSPLRKTRSVDDIKVGRDGLYIMKGGYSGVLLPQVPLEYGWDRDTFLAQTCRKAGLPPDAWKDGADIYVFTADVFGEE